MGLRETRHIGRIVVHPQDPDLVYVAALGDAFGPNEERGVYRSRAGGATCEKVLHRGPDAGAVALSIDPGNPRILFEEPGRAECTERGSQTMALPGARATLHK